MKKILLILSICFVSWSAQAVTMCAQDDAVIISTNVPSMKNYWPSSSANGGKWTLTTYFGMMMGVSACLNVSGSNNQPNSGIVANGGEQAGAYCWCKLLHPFVSYWVYVDTGWYSTYDPGSTMCNGYNTSSSDTVANCNSNCTYRCANRAKCNTTMRNNLFTGIQ